MALEDLPNGFAAPTRNEIRDRYQRDVSLRQEGAPTGEGSMAFVDGSVLADALLPLYANCTSVARGVDLNDMTRAQLLKEAKALGIPEELPPSAGAGFVIISASIGGVYIDETRELKDEARQLTFRCASANTYYDGKAVPIIGISTGPQTNLEAGARLKWSNPPAGLGSLATVQADADGEGLTGGRAAETNDDIRGRIRAARAEASVGGNVAQIRKLVKDAGRDLGIAVQEVFVYPAITGPGLYSYVFTLRSAAPGSSRIPDSVEIAAVRAYLRDSRLPEDDGIFAATIIEEALTACLGVKWAPKAVGWIDAQPWPRFADAFAVSAVTSSLVFRVASAVVGALAPEIGKTFAFYDARTRTFARKRITAVTDLGGGSYDLVIDGTNNTSDVGHVPAVGEAFCPYSESLDLLPDPLLSTLDSLGPGEQEEGPFDEGSRQKRMPEHPLEWSYEIRHSNLDGVEALRQVLDVVWLSPSIPYAPLVGVPSASANILRVTSVLAFPIN